MGVVLIICQCFPILVLKPLWTVFIFFFCTHTQFYFHQEKWWVESDVLGAGNTQKCAVHGEMFNYNVIHLLFWLDVENTCCNQIRAIYKILMSYNINFSQIISFMVHFFMSGARRSYVVVRHIHQQIISVHCWASLTL